MQCGKELGEAYETTEKQESEIESQNNEIKIMQAEINLFKNLNLGESEIQVTTGEEQIVQNNSILGSLLSGKVKGSNGG